MQKRSLGRTAAASRLCVHTRWGQICYSVKIEDVETLLSTFSRLCVLLVNRTVNKRWLLLLTYIPA